MTRPTLDPPLDLPTIARMPDRWERAAQLHAAFAPARSCFEPPVDADEDAVDADEDGSGSRPILFWWPTRLGVQLVLMPCRTLLQ